jgi:Ca2+-binding EF-hand superfamily protein
MTFRSKRCGRSLFYMFLSTAWAAIFLAAPVVSALEPAARAKQQAKANQSASVGSSSAATSELRHPSFEECDRNNDGFLDKSEAGTVPGLSANFERVDTNKDGKLDPAEFEKALAFLDTHRK